MAVAPVIVPLLLGLILLPGLSESLLKEALPTLDSALHHYETLHSSQLTHSRSTSPHNPSIHKRQVTFRTLGRDFQLHLTPYQGIFSPDFAAYSVDSYGKRSKVDVELNEYYYGYVQDEPRSKVFAHISEDGVLSGVIESEAGLYHIERSERYFSEPHSFHMIAYRDSDTKNRFNASHVDYVTGPTTYEHREYSLDAPGNEPEVLQKQQQPHIRLRRQLPGDLNGDSCRMILVADYLFFNKFGFGNTAEEKVMAVIRDIITVVSSVDLMIYRDAGWVVNVDDDTITGIGIDIGAVLVHNESSAQSRQENIEIYYNHLDLANAEANELLSEFNYGPWAGYCLAHLFTTRDFNSGLLGLANIASPQSSKTGGICSQSLTDSSGDPIIYNTGFSNQPSGGLIAQEIRLVTGHEIGHNWGSYHDTQGTFLMNEFAQDGSSSTHSMFSLTSRRNIGVVLLAKGDCFGARSGFCGDYQVDEGENCDEGPTGGSCCSSTCTLNTNAICSDFNYDCCKNCTIAGNDTECRQAGVSFDCRGNTFCTGDKLDCPPEEDAPPAEVGAACIGGECQIQNGTLTCVSLCDVLDLTECLCSSIDEECTVCCQSNGGSCQQIDVSGINGTVAQQIFLSNGHLCSIGVCLNGECIEGTDVVTKIFDVISNLDINEILEFMEDNIVGFVLILTSLVWIPGGLIIHCCYDRKVWKKFTEHGEDNFVDTYRRRVWERIPLISHHDTPDPEASASPPKPPPGDVGPQPRRVRAEPVDDTPLPPGYTPVPENVAIAW